MQRRDNSNLQFRRMNTKDESSIIQLNVIRLGKLVGFAMKKALKGKPFNTDVFLAKARARESEINTLEIEIEQDIQKLIKFKLEEKESRHLTALLKMNNDLERIGDYAMAIAKYLVEIDIKNVPDIEAKFKKLSKASLGMLERAVRALELGDLNLAKQVIKDDDHVDALNKSIIEKLLSSKTRDLVSLVALINLCRRLERTADHATNIAEDLVFWIEGDVIRHPLKKRSFYFHDIEIFPNSREIKIGEKIHLSKSEWEIFMNLIEKSPNGVSREELMKNALGYDSSVETRTIDQHVVGLRKKLGDKKEMLKSIPAFGYKILNS